MLLLVVLLLFCLHTSPFSYLPRANQRPVAIPLRMLQVFLDPDTYSSMSEEGVSLVGTILQFVVQKGGCVVHYSTTLGRRMVRILNIEMSTILYVVERFHCTHLLYVVERFHCTHLLYVVERFHCTHLLYTFAF